MESVVNNNLMVSSLPPEERGWEYKQITVTRVPGYGFGIAVSGGRDNPHFASGDPSIAVSDVLASGPAERLLHVNDRILSVNGISLQNVDYATAVQVLRDSGDTVVLVIKRRTASHQHTHSYGAAPPPLAALGINPLPPKVTLTKNSKKEDFGIILGCKLFVKEISSKAREQLLNTNQVLSEGDFITKLNNTNCNDLMSLKEAKKIIDSSKDKLHLTVVRDYTTASGLNISHQAQSSVSTTGAVNNFYKDDFLTSPQSYSNQNLYVQPPTRNHNINTNGGFEDKIEPNSGPNSLLDDKNNLAPRGRLRQPLSEANINHINRNSLEGYGRAKSKEEPPRPPPPRAEDYYSSRRQIYDDDPIGQKTKQPVPDARYITFHKEGSVGIRLTGGNFVGIFVTAVQPGSPASLQGLQPGDKILKVNDMDMTGVTREEAVLFLLSLQDRIELIVQFCKEEYDGIVASQKGDSFYIKTHFHYENCTKGEMCFKSGDIFHVIDTLYNGVVGCWQVYRIGRNNQQGQKGIIPNKARAEELATAQFNATKKEMSANESRGSFFRRRRNSNRRSKSLGKEHWDDILFSDTVSKFPAYERVVLKHPGFMRPVVLFGPIADVAREKLIKDFPDKFISPQLDSNLEDTKSHKMSSNIIRLSAIREVISTGKHALLDITPNAVERLNYAQLYPITVFFKTETKIIIKQMRQGLPKSAHKSSKKLLEQCQKLDKVWSHIFCSTITLNDSTDNWYRKVREIIDKHQGGAVWMSETKPEESLSDDFLFPMSSLRLSYASSPESDLEHSPGPPLSPTLSNPNPGRLTKASSDPSVVMADNSPTDALPPYQPNYDSRYGFSSGVKSNQDQSNSSLTNAINNNNIINNNNNELGSGYLDQQDMLNIPPEIATNGGEVPQSPYKQQSGSGLYGSSNSQDYQHHNGYSKDESRHEYMKSDSGHHKRQPGGSGSNYHGHYNHVKGHSLGDGTPRRSPRDERIYGGAPDLPPRIDRGVKPLGIHTTPSKTPNGRSAHERLFGTKAPQQNNDNIEHNNGPMENGNFNGNHKHSSLDRSVNSKSDSLSSYDSLNKQLNSNGPPNSNAPSAGLGPNAHDDLKTTLSKIEDNVGSPNLKYQSRRDPQGSRHERMSSKLDLKYGSGGSGGHTSTNDLVEESPRNSRELDNEPSMDHGGSRSSVERERQDMYRYSRSPKHNTPTKTYMETKTDYGKYSRNNNSMQDYIKSSHQDLTQSHLSIHNMPPHHHSPMKTSNYHHSNGYDNGMSPQGISGGGGGGGGTGPPNSYKPVPPPKPKNYKPPYKNNYGDPMMQPPLPYQHGKSFSNPDQQYPPPPPVNVPKQDYYYNVAPNNTWHTETAVRYNSTIHGPYDMASPYDAHRHANISYASRSEIAPISRDAYGMEGGDVVEGRMAADRPSIVDLQGSREQRGSAFELYRKPVHHNLRNREQYAFYGSQPNIAHNFTNSANTNNNTPKVGRKLTKTQSFSHRKKDGSGGGSASNTPQLFRKLLFRGRKKDSPSKKGGKRESPHPDTIDEHCATLGVDNRGHRCSPDAVAAARVQNSRDVTSAVVDWHGGKLVNEYWGVTLDIPPYAVPEGKQQEVYFVITDPRLCENAPPLDLDNGEAMLSPLVMCGPQGTEFLKPVILSIPHYANTLPSLGISLKATDSEKDIHTDWDNILLPSNHTANTVSVKVDHF